ncbi:MAG: L-threonylcarbamoyladenylate synthase [Chloroflexota bacterium]
MHDTKTRVLVAKGPNDDCSLEEASSVLQAGGLVSLPTDTVYGIAALFSDDQAVQRLYQAKERPDEKAIPLLLASIEQLELVCKANELAYRLAKCFWPGPLTLVVRKSDQVSQVVSATPTVALRIPDHPLTLALIDRVGAPLAVTSANLSGHPPIIDPNKVMAGLEGRIDLLLDGGLAPGGVPSTIVDCTGEQPRILRKGPISRDDIFGCVRLIRCC